VTYMRLQTGWMYLVAVLDWFSRYIVSWELDDTLQQPFVLAAAQRALTRATPVIWNSDQGSHCASPQSRELRLVAGVPISMDGKGRALDNINALAPVALSQTGRGLSPRLRQPARGACGLVTLPGVLPSRATAPGARLSDTGGSLFPVFGHRVR